MDFRFERSISAELHRYYGNLPGATQAPARLTLTARLSRRTVPARENDPFPGDDLS